MLTHLYIRDFVIVDTLALDFSEGFGVLTGETGAGKSILLDALSLILGGRAERQVIREGAARAELAATFLLAPKGRAMQWLNESAYTQEDVLGKGHDDEGHTLLLRRIIETGKPARCWINGSPASVAQLRALGALLADIHGQHAHLSLLETSAQRALLDAHAGITELARSVATSWKTWKDATSALNAMQANGTRLEEERTLLQFQAEELAQLAFDVDAWQEDNAEHRRLAHAGHIQSGIEEILNMLDEGDPAVRSMLVQAGQRLLAVRDYDERLAEPAELLENASIQLHEAVHALCRYRDHLEVDPQRLQALDARIAEVLDAARKHRVTPDALPEVAASIANRLTALGRAVDGEALARQAEAALNVWQTQAAQLSARRREAAALLSSEVSAAMQTLAMPGGCFEIALTARNEPSAQGAEDVVFLVRAHAGQSLQPLAKVVSGGELSRIGLAIQVIASAGSDTPTLIFDEVDAGIGGGVAEIVGRMLRRLGKARQVLCVTHLPQVAACAHWQWRVEKREMAGDEGDATLVASHVTALDDTQRIEELARMLGGSATSQTSRRHAHALLVSAREEGEHVATT